MTGINAKDRRRETLEWLTLDEWANDSVHRHAPIAEDTSAIDPKPKPHKRHLGWLKLHRWAFMGESLFELDEQDDHHMVLTAVMHRKADYATQVAFETGAQWALESVALEKALKANKRGNERHDTARAEIDAVLDRIRPLGLSGKAEATKVLDELGNETIERLKISDSVASMVKRIARQRKNEDSA